ncbi:MAG: F0F1 ATP synthase subunit epsilon [Acidobacteria bacterium]|nr:MAG: F0F1 ATP synthase subunit epsilon [Acidobacteriota bacterium]
MAERPIELIVVSPERSVVHEYVDELEIPGADGYFGVLPGHAALFSELKVGELGYRQGDKWFFLSVAWGFAEVHSDHVRILAETAERAHEVDIDRAMRAKERAEQRIAKGGDDIDYQRALVSLERAMIRIQVSRKTQQGTRA